MSRYQTYLEYRESEVIRLGPIPSHWEVMQLKRTVDGCINGIWGSEPKKDGSDTIVLRVADFDRPKLSLQVDGYTYRKIEEKDKTARKLKRGDLLLEKSGGGERTLVGQVVLFDKDFEAVTSNFVAKMTPNEGFNSRFLNYVFSRFYNDNINYCSIKQNTGIQNLDAGAYLAEKFGFPLAEEQEKIANFLDYETAKIDTLIEKQEQLIKLLKEKRQAVISLAVTKGLNPNAPMRDSGVEWLGDVPEHWDVCKIKHKCSEITDGAHVSPETEGGRHYFVSITDIKKGVIDFENALLTTTESYEYLIKTGCMPFEGDILFSKDGTIGQTAVTPKDIEFVVASSLIIIRPNHAKVTSQYLNFLLQSGVTVEQVESFVKGAALRRLSIQNLLKIVGIFPPIDEQNKISNYLVQKLEKYDDLELKANSLISLQKERRAALISAAVTGKIDVRNWQAPQ